MSLTKRPDPDGTFSLLGDDGQVVARGIAGQDADAQIAAEQAGKAAADTPIAAEKPAGKPRNREDRD